MTLLSEMRRIKLWQVGILLVVLAGAAAGVILGFGFVDFSKGEGLTEKQTVIPAQVGDLVKQVSVSGNLIYPETETLTFGTSGTVGKVLVEKGQQVKKDQPLAELDAATIANLQKAVAQAELDVQKALDAVDAAKAPYSQKDIVEAEASVADKKLALQTAQEQLDSLLKPSDQALAQARSSVANARLALQNAQTKLSKLVSSSQQAIAQAQSAVASARLALQTAQDKLDTLKSQPAADDLAAAQTKVDTARKDLANAQADLAVARTDWDNKLSTAQGTYDDAVQTYGDTFNKFLGIKLTGAQSGLAPDAALQSLGVDVEILFDRLRTPLAALAGVRLNEIPGDDPATPYNEFTVYSWLYLYPGNISSSCSGAASSSRVICIREDMVAAWEAVEPAARTLESTKAQAEKALATSGKSVTQTQDALDAAVETLETLKAGPDPVEVQAKESDVALAKANLKVAEENLAALGVAPDPVEKLTKEYDVAVAQANLKVAEENLATLEGAPDPVEVDAKRKTVERARAALAYAEETLADMKAGADPLLVALKQADVSSARESLSLARDKLARTTLRSPFNGIVSDLPVVAGQSIAANASVAVMADPSIVEISSYIDEVDSLLVRQGAKASITLDALKGQTLEGTVSSVSQTARTQSGVVSYPVNIRVTVPQGVDLRAGLTATAKIVLSQKTNVLLIPSQAILGTYDRPYVRLQKNDVIKEQVVALGDSDDFYTIITSGLKEGDKVVMDITATTTSQTTFRGMQGITGGTGIMISPDGGFQPPR
jgi:multidrug efflux pump subunit AcrA (membrane-fusion protein)